MFVDENCEEEEAPFVLVTSKRQKSKNSKTIHYFHKQLRSSEKLPFVAEEEDQTFEKSTELRKRIENSEYFAQSIEILSNQSKQPITKIVCFGIGRIRHCYAARYQLAYILAIKSSLGLKSIEFHEPVLNHHDKDLLEALDCKLYPVNCEGKYEFASSETNLVFLPHCPKQLVNNLLWKNWSSDVLNQIILISNSFHSIVQQTPVSCIAQDAGFISRIDPYTTEFTLRNSFEHKNVFNDIAIHFFNTKNCEKNFFDILKMASSIYRSLINELRLASPNGIMNKDALVFKYISSQFRKYKTTDQQLCKAREEMKFLGSTYLCYLRSLRKQVDIQKHYKGSGERSVKNTADMVGFKLPHDP
ncbi:SRR1-like protein, partial [Pseudolycoriella hygida]